MKPLTREWAGKAEGDYATACRELRARKQPNYDAACFHAQRCAEKYLKALLLENGFEVPRSHNLDALARPIFASVPFLKELSSDLRTLTAFAVETRYPGKSVDRQIAREAVDIAATIRERIGKLLKAPGSR
jgi:HEPN domain-containing protein